ncbi:TonB family protein [Undibacterium sp. RuRC25W]|uniref:TonB family protein n=1 Tax=Undibacterium sp. RuRC25W TaxID=3413047 RepID=UPI003BF01FE0
MNLFPRKNNHQLPSEVKRRLTIAIVASLLLHALLLSLQFAIPSGGISGGEASLSQQTGAPTAMVLTIQSVENTVQSASQVEPSAALESQNKPITPTVTVTPAEIHGLQLVAPFVAAKVPPPYAEKNVEKSAQKSEKYLQRKSASVMRATRAHKVPVSEIPDLIAQDVIKDENFVVAVRDPDEIKKEDVPQEIVPRSPEPLTVAQTQAKTELTHEEKTLPPLAEPDVAPASVARYDADDSLRQKKEAERLKRMDSLVTMHHQDTSVHEKIIKQLDEESHLQTEQLRREQLAALALKQQLDAEENRRRAQQDASNATVLSKAEAQRTENIRQVDEEIEQQLQQELSQRDVQRKERLKAMALSRQQNEEREENERRAVQEAEMQRQQQARMLAQQEAAQAALAAQAVLLSKNSETTNQGGNNHSAIQTRSAYAGTASDEDLFGSRSTHGAANNSNATTTALILPKSLLSSDLANRARESSRGLGLLPGNLPAPTLDEKARRHTIINSSEKNLQLRMYADSWKQKIERNGNLNYSQSASNKVRADPLVSVAIRSDGSVEQVTILRSSGREDIDRAVRNIVRINARFAAFPPEIAAQYDVLEIRRIWSFDDNLKLIEELR